MILRWRQYEFALTADIEKMYRQILVHPSDIDFQRVLWRSSPNDAVTAFHLRTITYGTTSAPFLALRVIKQLVDDEGGDFPLAASVLRNQTYVDDCIFGVESEEIAIQTRDQLVSLLDRGRFRLRKWASNCANLLQDLDPSNHGLACDRDLSPDESLHVLGVGWRPEETSCIFQ